MNYLTTQAICAEIDGEIFENYAQITASYTFAPLLGKSAELTLPYLPNGVICSLTVSCDGKEISSAKAANIREISAAPMENLIFAADRQAGVLILRLCNVDAKESISVSVTVCLTLKRYKNYASLTLTGLGSLADCPTDIYIKIHGCVKKLISPTHSIVTSVSDNLSEVSGTGNIYGDSFALDIFYAENPSNGIFISRQHLEKNIALCRFVPTLDSKRNTRKAFDINIAVSSDRSRQDIIMAAVAFLRCLNTSCSFRLSVNSVPLTDFITAGPRNIDKAINLICQADSCGKLSLESSDENTVIICSGKDYDEKISTSGKALIILSGDFDNLSLWQKLGRTLCVSENNAEILVPYGFSELYEKSVSPAKIQAIGGIGTELLNDSFDSLTKNSVNFCFARHDIIPPKSLKILDKNYKKVEEIELNVLSTQLKVRAIDILYSCELIRKLQLEANSAKPEEYCIFREQINEICLNNNIAFGDIALISTISGNPAGFISKDEKAKRDYGKYFREDTPANRDEIIALILKSQTTDGAVADISVARPDQLVFSTAVCLIALYLCEKTKYAAFAKRSLDFLRRKPGFWAETAVNLWNGREIDFALLSEKLEMKIMNERLDELAVLLIRSLLKSY